MTQFVASSARYVNRMVDRADINKDGNIVGNDEVNKLSDLKDTFELYGNSNAESFKNFYGDYVRVSANIGELPENLRDNYKNWSAAQPIQTPPSTFNETDLLQQFIMGLAANVFDYYGPGDEDVYQQDSDRLENLLSQNEVTHREVPHTLIEDGSSVPTMTERITEVGKSLFETEFFEGAIYAFWDRQGTLIGLGYGSEPGVLEHVE